MKVLNNYNVSVPELGDLPNITQVSDALEAIEESIAGNVEFMYSTVSGSQIVLTSDSRNTERLRYYEGMSLQFTARVAISANTIQTIKVDSLTAQPASIPFNVGIDETLMVTYTNGSFVSKYFFIAKSDSVMSNDQVVVASSKAVKTAYDKGVSAYSLAETKENVFVKKSGFNKDKSDAINLNDSSILATSKAVKLAYDLAETKMTPYDGSAYVSSKGTVWTRGEVNDIPVGLHMIDGDANTSELGLPISTDLYNLIKFPGLSQGRFTLRIVTRDGLIYTGNSHSGYGTDLATEIEWIKEYTSYDKPTPAEIGAVATTNITDSTSTTSSSKVASATAVKKAYDLANIKLPLTGGTITSSEAAPLTIKRTVSEINVAIELKTATEDKFLGLGASGILKFGSTLNLNEDGYEIFHEGNKPTPAEIGALSLTASSVATNGYRKTSDGLIIQWGTGLTRNTVTFPITFPNAIFSINATGISYSFDGAWGVYEITNSSFVTRGDDMGSGAQHYWLAIGY